MGYPINYRSGGRGLQNARAVAAQFPDPLPWQGAGYLAGGLAALWMAQQLGGALGNWIGATSPPSSYGWTLDFACAGKLPMKQMRQTPGGCTTNIFLEASYLARGVPLPTDNFTSFWDTRLTTFQIIGVQRRYNNVAVAQRWSRGAAGPLPAVTWYPGRPWRRLPMTLPRELAPGQSVRASAPPEEGFVGYPGNPFLGARWGRWELFNRVVHDADGTTHPPRPVPVPRAIPFPATKEVKVNVNTPAGRAFFGVLQAFNFMGDAWGLTRALWRALPKDRRGSSRRLDRMLLDLWNGMDHFGSERAQAHAAMNIALWKFSDTVMGSTQASIFGAQSSAYGFNAARAWSFLDSEIRAGEQNVERMAAQGRSQSSTAF